MIKPVVQIIENRIPLLTGVIRQRAGDLTMKTALQIQGRIRTGMAEPKTGRMYLRRGIAHQASAPGEMPAVDTGFLTNSIQVERMPDGVSAAVFTNAEYAEVLELGGVHIEARPFMQPAADAETAPFEAEVTRLLLGL
jgi:phage gpG-like protein